MGFFDEKFCPDEDLELGFGQKIFGASDSFPKVAAAAPEFVYHLGNLKLW